MIHLKRFVFNFIEENTYVIYDDSGEAVIVDCGARTGDEQQQLFSFVKENGLRPRRHLLTHAHFDHVFGAQYVYDEFGLMPEVSAGEVDNYTHAAEYMQMFIHRALPFQLPPYTVSLADGAEISVGEIFIRVISTPGHTAGGVCFYMPQQDMLLSGDTVFQRSVGRTDLPGGSADALRSSIARRILTLPPQTRIFPGHGPETSVAEESGAAYYF